MLYQRESRVFFHVVSNAIDILLFVFSFLVLISVSIGYLTQSLA